MPYNNTDKSWCTEKICKIFERVGYIHANIQQPKETIKKL